MKKGLENLCHLREDERSEAEAKRQDPELPHPAFPAEAKEAAGRGSDGDVEVGVLEVDGRRPIPWTKEKGAPRSQEESKAEPSDHFQPEYCMVR